MKNIDRAVEKYRELILDTERYVWRNPETGYKETKTSKYMAEQFEKLGYTLTYADGITGFYTVFDTVTKYTNIKLVNKVSKTIFNWTRILIRAATLTLTVYGLCVATMDQINPIDIILTTLMIIMWILSVLIEIVRNIFNSKKDLFIDAFHKDIEEIKKPITTTTNVVKRIFGKEVEEKEDSENIKKLSKFIYKNKEKGIKK